MGVSLLAGLTRICAAPTYLPACLTRGTAAGQLELPPGPLPRGLRPALRSGAPCQVPAPHAPRPAGALRSLTAFEAGHMEESWLTSKTSLFSLHTLFGGEQIIFLLFHGCWRRALGHLLKGTCC